MTEQPKCKVCGDPMPIGEEMFFYHGYSGPCPNPPLPKKEESGWLIEIGQLCVGLCGKRLKLVTFSDPNAMRFESKEKAEDLCKELRLTPDRISEHSWG